jgi:ribonuclease-3
MTVDDAERVAQLEERVGAPFANRVIALAAVTHKSWVNEHRGEGGEDNERLEFLGDAVIDLVVSEFLMSRFPQAREGDLSKLRAAVVDEAGLAAMGRALGLGELLRLGRGEELTGGREKASLLADAMEAVIAAVFLDRGLGATHALVARFLGDAYARAETGSLDRDWKTQLQELGQARHRASPRYRVVAEVGPDHSKIFEIEVELRGVVLGRGSGRSKKDGEQAAARVALEALATPTPPAVEEGAAPPGAAAAGSPPAAEPEAVPGPDREPGPVPVPEPEVAVPPRKPRAVRRVAKVAKVASVAKKGGKGGARAPRPEGRKAGRPDATPRKAPTRRSRKIADPRGRD